MDRSELRTRLSGLGFARFGTTVLNEIVEDARAELDDAENWPYLEYNVSGTAPLAITDLKEVDQVFDSTTGLPIDKRSYRELVNDYGDLSLSVGGGSPFYWYKATPSGVPTVATYPVSSATIEVQYYRVSPPFTADSDEPLAPDRYHSLIVRIAERMAHERAGDMATAAGIQAQIDRGLQRMRDSLFPDDSGENMIVTGESCDW